MPFNRVFSFDGKIYRRLIVNIVCNLQWARPGPMTKYSLLRSSPGITSFPVASITCTSFETLRSCPMSLETERLINYYSQPRYRWLTKCVLKLNYRASLGMRFFVRVCVCACLLKMFAIRPIGGVSLCNSLAETVRLLYVTVISVVRIFVAPV